MSLNYHTLSNKPVISKKSDFDGSDTVSFLDLASSVLNIDNVRMNDCMLVDITEDYVARPDLVSLAVYGTDEYGDVLCKVNGISNPFELNAGMTLFIPDITAARALFKQGRTSSLATDDSYISAKDKKNQKLKNETRTAAEQTVGEKSFVIDRTNKLIYY